MPQPTRVKVTNYFDRWQLERFDDIEAETGILRSEQVRRGATLWIRSQGGTVPQTERRRPERHRRP